MDFLYLLRDAQIAWPDGRKALGLMGDAIDKLNAGELHDAIQLANQACGLALEAGADNGLAWTKLCAAIVEEAGRVRNNRLGR